MKKVFAVSMITVMSMGLAACATSGADSVGADAMGRTIPERISDSSIELTARRNLATIPGISENNVRIAIDSYRRDVLLTGEVPSEQIKVEIGRTIESMKDVNKVFNYLTVTETPKAKAIRCTKTICAQKSMRAYSPIVTSNPHNIKSSSATAPPM